MGALAAVAQNYRGGISGIVTDPSGAVVQAAKVTLVETATQAQHETSSSSAGIYTFEGLPVGRYDLSVTAPGFASLRLSGVLIEAGRIASQPVQLHVAAGAEVATVTASDLTLDTEDSAQTSIITPQVMENVPLNGQDFTQLLKLVPGYSNSGNLGGTLNGGRTNTIDWQIDGVDNNDLWFNYYSVNQGGEASIAATLLPIDAIEELSVQSSGGADSVGRTSGGTTNAVLKSGTNSLHGDVFYFNRNEDLSLANWFGSNVPKVRDQDFGGSVGGPIQKNKTFAFVAYEQQKLTLGHSLYDTVPSPAWVSLADALVQARGQAVNAVSTNLLSFYPGMGNAPATIDNYFTTEPDEDTSYNGLVKLDHTFADQSNLSLHWFGGTGKQVAYNGSALAAYYQRVPSRMNNVAAVYNRNFNSHWNSQTLVGVNFYDQAYYDVDTNFDPVDEGLNTGVTSADLKGAPDIAISNFTEIGLTAPNKRYQYTGHLTENNSYLLGRHTFRFGGEYRHAVVNVAYHRSQRGSFSFSGNEGPSLSALSSNDAWDADQYLLDQGYTDAEASNLYGALDGLADFMAGNLGAGNAGIVYGDIKRRYLINSLSFYGGDTWKITPRLTATYGLYWNFTSPPNDPTDRISTFLPGRGGFVYTGHGLDTIYPRDLKDFAPRVGLSWQPKSLNKVVLRAGFGLYYQTPNMNYFSDNRPRDNNNSYGVQYNPYLYAISGSPDTSVLSYSNSTAFTIVDNQAIFTGNGTTELGGFSIDQRFTTGYSENYNFNVEYQLTPTTLFELGYVGNESHHLPVTLEINQIPLGSNTSEGVLNNAARPYYADFPELQGIDQVESVSNGVYNSMIASLRTTNWHHLSGSISYTLGNSKDDISGARGSLPENSYDLKADWGNSDQDVRSNLGAYVSYALPTPHSHSAILGGWQVNAWVTSFTGNPFTVKTSKDVSLTGQYRDRVNVVGNPLKVKGSNVSHTAVSWFNPYYCGQTDASGATVTDNCFAEPTDGTYGNEKRNQFYGPGLNETDLSLFKNTRIGERINTQFRVEMFNLFNVRNLSSPDTGLYDGSTSFGYITSTPNNGGSPGIGLGEPFNVQLALKVSF